MDLRDGASITAELTTVGRKPGQRRTVELRFFYSQGCFYATSSRIAGKHWCQNLIADPSVEITATGIRLACTARQITDDRLKRPDLTLRGYLWKWIGWCSKSNRSARVNLESCDKDGGFFPEGKGRHLCSAYLAFWSSGALSSFSTPFCIPSYIFCSRCAPSCRTRCTSLSRSAEAFSSLLQDTIRPQATPLRQFPDSSCEFFLFRLIDLKL